MFTIKHHQIKPEIFDNPLFSIHLKGMRLYGFIMGTNQRFQLWHFLRCTIFTLSFIAAFGLNFIENMRNFDSLAANFMSKSQTIGLFSTSIVILNGILQRKRILKLINFVHEDMLTMRQGFDDLEEQNFNRIVKYVRRITYYFLIPTVIIGTVSTLDYMCQSIFNADTSQHPNGTLKPHILLEAYPFGEVWDNSIVRNFGPVYVAQLGIYTLPALHTFSTCLMMYMKWKIEVISKRLSEMDLTKINSGLQSAAKNIAQLEESEENYRRLKMCEYCAREQIKIRWFVRELGQLLRIPVFVDFLCFSVLICFLLYGMTTGNLSSENMVYTCFTIAVMSGYQILYHWHATLVTKSHEAMGFAIYSCDWYNYSLNVKKAIRLIMMDSDRPLVMCAIFVELKVTTVVDIFRAAFSYYSLLRKLNEK